MIPLYTCSITISHRRTLSPCAAVLCKAGGSAQCSRWRKNSAPSRRRVPHAMHIRSLPSYCKRSLHSAASLGRARAAQFSATACDLRLGGSPCTRTCSAPLKASGRYVGQSRGCAAARRQRRAGGSGGGGRRGPDIAERRGAALLTAAHSRGADHVPAGLEQEAGEFRSCLWGRPPPPPACHASRRHLLRPPPTYWCPLSYPPLAGLPRRFMTWRARARRVGSRPGWR